MADQPHKFRSKPRSCRNWLFLVCLAGALTGCSTPRTSASANYRQFDFSRDTLDYANELVWQYRFDAQGKWTRRPRKPKPDYTHHCFVVACSAKQFFAHARFEPDHPQVDTETYRRLVRKVVSSSPRKTSSEEQKIVFPGFANLRAFSQSHEALLKAECGSAWRSYFQRGHWRMIFPFNRSHQKTLVQRLAETLRHNQPSVVHLVRFPSLKINHAVVLFSAAESDTEIRFAAYDPNDPARPIVLTYDRSNRTFSFPTNFYFPGGRVDVYEIYRGCCY